MKKELKKSISASLCLASIALTSISTQVIAQEAAPAAPAEAPAQAGPTLTVGSAVPALEGITWLQGEEVKALNEKGKVYILECWATWCGPCVSIIPHVNDLHKKYADKGLVIIGMNVFEDGVDKAKDFLKKQGEGMSYRVAYSGGREGAFGKTWLQAAGVDSIPRALVVIDGKLILNTHPSALNDEMIEKLLSGKFDAATYEKEQAAKQKEAEELRAKVGPLFQAQKWDEIITFANTLKNDNPAKVQLLLTAVSRKADWKALATLRDEVSKETYKGVKVTEIDEMAALSMAKGDDSAAFATKALADLAAPAKDAEAMEVMHATVIKARLQFLAGKTDDSIATLAEAKKLVATIDNEQAKPVLEKILNAADAALKEGNFPPIYELAKGQ